MEYIMKNKAIALSLLLTLITALFSSSGALAHLGRTDSSGGHYCRPNCAKWGLSDGEYHYYHNEGSSSSNSSSSKKENVKSKKIPSISSSNHRPLNVKETNCWNSSGILF